MAGENGGVDARQPGESDRPESSKEELQSANEELKTLNHQLQRKVEELEGTTNDLNNLLASLDVAILFLDRELQIRWFSPAIDDPTGTVQRRPVAELASKFDDPHLQRDAATVLERLVPAETVVPAQGRWYLRRIVPYRTQDDRVEGVVVTFVDITSRKKGEEALRAAHEQLHAIFDAVREPLVVLGPNLRVRSANASFYDAFQTDPADAENKLIFELGDGQWNLPELRRQLSEVLPERKGFDGFDVEQEFVGLGRRALTLSARQIDELEMILLSIEDVTERRRWEEEQRILLAELGHRVKNTLATAQAIASQTARTSPNLEAFQRAFSGRLAALDAAHGLLIEGRWERARLHAVLTLPLEAYEGSDGERVRVRGDDVALTAKAVLTMSMIVNELATNAAKYGALSAPSGRIDVETGLETSEAGQAVTVMWRESGGPQVEPPEERGLGLSLIERSIAHELDGEARIEFSESGLRCRLAIPYNPENVQVG